MHVAMNPDRVTCVDHRSNVIAGCYPIGSMAKARPGSNETSRAGFPFASDRSTIDGVLPPARTMAGCRRSGATAAFQGAGVSSDLGRISNKMRCPCLRWPAILVGVRRSPDGPGWPDTETGTCCKAERRTPDRYRAPIHGRVWLIGLAQRRRWVLEMRIDALLQNRFMFFFVEDVMNRMGEGKWNRR